MSSVRPSAGPIRRRVLAATTAVALAASGASAATDVIAIAPPSGGFPAYFAPPANAASLYTTYRQDAPALGPVMLYRHGPAGDVAIAAAGQAVPTGPGTFLSVGAAHVNALGQVGFVGSIEGAGVTAANNSGLYRGDGVSVLQLARTGNNAPITGAGRANGQYAHFYSLALNDAGQAAFFADLTGTVGSQIDNSGIFRSDGITQVALAREDDAAPGGGFFRAFNDPSIDTLGRGTFLATTSTAAGGANDGSGIFRSDGASRTAIARVGGAAPGRPAGATIGGLDNPAVSRAGVTAFQAFVGDDFQSVLYRGDASGATLTELAVAGAAVPGRAATMTGAFRPTAVNDAGRVAFLASFTRDAAPGDLRTGLFFAQGPLPVAVALEGDAAPDGNGKIGFADPDGEGVGNAAANGVGQLAFLATLTDTANGEADDRALYFFDDSAGLVTVAREGGSLLGSTIVALNFNAGSGPFGSYGANFDGLSDAGEVTYSFTLADGRSGVAVWTNVPEPTALLASVMGLLTLVRRSRR